MRDAAIKSLFDHSQSMGVNENLLRRQTNDTLALAPNGLRYEIMLPNEHPRITVARLWPGAVHSSMPSDLRERNRSEKFIGALFRFG